MAADQSGAVRDTGGQPPPVYGAESPGRRAGSRNPLLLPSVTEDDRPHQFASAGGHGDPLQRRPKKDRRPELEPGPNGSVPQPPPDTRFDSGALAITITTGGHKKTMIVPTAQIKGKRMSTKEIITLIELHGSMYSTAAEAPRQANETPWEYERRILRLYGSAEACRYLLRRIAEQRTS